MDDKGVTGTGGVVAAMGFFVTGTSAAIASGSNTTGYLEEDVPVAFASAPAPMMVQPTVAGPMAAPAAQQPLVTVATAAVPAPATKAIPAVATGARPRL